MMRSTLPRMLTTLALLCLLSTTGNTATPEPVDEAAGCEGWPRAFGGQCPEPPRSLLLSKGCKPGVACVAITKGEFKAYRDDRVSLKACEKRKPEEAAKCDARVRAAEKNAATQKARGDRLHDQNDALREQLKPIPHWNGWRELRVSLAGAGCLVGIVWLATDQSLGAAATTGAACTATVTLAVW